MNDPKPRKEEMRIDGEEITNKVKKTFEGGVQTEEIKVQGDQLLAKVKELVRAGNVRRIIIKNTQGIRVLEVPLTLGVVGAVMLPVWAAIGAVAALAADYTIVVEKVEQE